MKVDLTKAKELLLKGNVVAIPTETVYGLGGWIGSEAGLLKIFSTKERPFFDPLIVHVSSLADAKKLTPEWTKAHEILGQKFWPGPLTLIAKKNDDLNPLITSGLDSVGIRCPNHPLTLELLKEIPGGVAAPSANKFGKTSPTSFLHVEDEFQKEVAVLDGGESSVGIESTVVGIKESNNEYQIEIYRPGSITASMIEDAFKGSPLKVTVTYEQSPVAPGQLKHHYMPKIPLVLVPPRFDWGKNAEKISLELKSSFKNPAFWSQPESAQLASRELYQKMREFDKEGFDIIITEIYPHHSQEEWRGIINRLDKAKSLRIKD